MKEWLKRNRTNLIATSFLIPILLVAFVSISHVTQFYGITNPMSWAIYLSLAVEIAALSALAGISVGMRRFIYLPFGIVTFIQLVGNIFYSYQYIDIQSKLFKAWVELVSPLLDLMGLDSADPMVEKRILAFVSGGLLPCISLTFLHMLTKFKKAEEASATIQVQPDVPQPSPVLIDEDTMSKLENFLMKQPAAPPETPPVPRLTDEEKEAAIAKLIATASPTMTPTVTPTMTPSPTPSGYISPFPKVGGMLKKFNTYDNPNRRGN